MLNLLRYRGTVSHESDGLQHCRRNQDQHGSEYDCQNTDLEAGKGAASPVGPLCDEQKDRCRERDGH